MDSSCNKSLTSEIKSSFMSASIFEKGSSNKRIFGDVAKALARATLCCSPPDSS